MISPTTHTGWGNGEKFLLLGSIHRYGENYVEVSRLLTRLVADTLLIDITDLNRYSVEACVAQVKQIKDAHKNLSLDEIRKSIGALYRKELMERFAKEQEGLQLAKQQLEMIQRGQVTKEEEAAILQQTLKENEVDRIIEMRFANKQRALKQEEVKWQEMAQIPANLKIKLESDTKIKLESDTSAVDMDVEDITSSIKAPTNQQQSQPPPTSISPLLSSLLKSPTGPSMHQVTSRATATAPTITTLLTSGSIPNQNQPAITLKSMPPNEAAHLLTRPISGPPIEATASGGQPHTAPQHVISPSQSAPTLSMLLEKTKTVPVVNPTTTTPIEKVEHKTVKEEPALQNVNCAEVAMEMDEIVDTIPSNTELNSGESDENDEQLMEVFQSIGNIAAIEGIDVAAVIQDEEGFMKDVEEEPANDDEEGAELETKAENDKEKVTEDDTEDQVVTENDVPKAAFSTDDDEDDDIPLAAVASLDHSAKSHNSDDSLEKSDTLKTKVETATPTEINNDDETTGEGLVEESASKPNSPSENLVDDEEEVEEGEEPVVNDEAEYLEDTSNQNDARKSPVQSEGSSDVILIPTDDDESNSEKKIQHEEAEETSEAHDEQELLKESDANEEKDQDDAKSQEEEAELDIEETEQTVMHEEESKDTLEKDDNNANEEDSHYPTEDANEPSSSMQTIDTDAKTFNPPIISILDTDDSSTTDVSIITRKDERISSPSKLPHQPRRSGHDQRTDDHSNATITTTAPPVRPPLLRKLRDRDRSESPMVEDDATGTSSNDHSGNQRLHRRCSSTPISDSIPSSPASSEREDRDVRVSKKKLLSIYNALQPHKYATFFQRMKTYLAQGVVLRPPLDMQIIKKQIESGEIHSMFDLIHAVMMMITNANMIAKHASEDEKMLQRFFNECNQIREFKMHQGQVNSEKDYKEEKTNVGGTAAPAAATTTTSLTPHGTADSTSAPTTNTTTTTTTQATAHTSHSVKGSRTGYRKSLRNH